MIYKEKNVLVYGKGISGLGAKKALEYFGAKVTIVDEFDYFFSNDFLSGAKYDFIVVSPSIGLEHRIFNYALKHQIEIIGELELGSRLFKGKIIAITGTNGKTTTTSLVGEIFKKAGLRVIIAGNIGVSFCSQVVDFPNADYAIVEVSSFQMETVEFFKPHIACVINIKSDHLDRHKTLNNYAKLKLNLSKKMTANDYLILSSEDIETSLLMDFTHNTNLLYASLGSIVNGVYYLNDNNLIYCGEEKICNRRDIKLKGEHNIQNCLFAIIIAKLCKIDNGAIKEVLSYFETDDHRCKFVDRVNGKNYYNDSKGTNISATQKAMLSMEGSTCVILGGSDKGYEYDELFLNITNSIMYVIVLGEVAEKIKKSAISCGFKNVIEANDLKDAVVKASNAKCENVLLSPASASFDMFKNYKERGEYFEKIVKELKN